MEQIDAEFVGFFYADGSAFITKYRKGKYTLYRPQLVLPQRDDNRSLLETVQKRYGGSIYKRNVQKHNMKGTKPVLVWQTTSVELCKKITDLLLQSKLESKNLKAVRAVNEYCKWKLGVGLKAKTAKDAPQIERWRAEITKAHQYQE